MNIKKRISNYFSKKSKWNIASDIVIVMLIIAFLIPQSRLLLGTWVNKIKILIVSPSVNNDDEMVQLKARDYEVVFQDLQGNDIDLSKLKNKVIFINFWATWCPPCVAEMPSIQKLYNRYKNDDNIKFFIVSDEQHEKVLKFMKDKEYSFPVYTSRFKLPEVFSHGSIPTTFLISKSGKIVVHETGASDWGSSKMFKVINNLIVNSKSR